MNLSIEVECEEDGRWLAEVPELPGVMAYGESQRDAVAKAEVLALRVLAEQIENGEAAPVSIGPKMLARMAKHTGLQPRDL